MIRRVIEIDEDRCNGCGLCAEACHEGAIEIVGGKAKLARENYCDGLGDCLPACPMDAISFVEREAAEYNEAAVRAAAGARAADTQGDAARKSASAQAEGATGMAASSSGAPASALSTWPVQIKLVPVSASYFDGANLLIAADCTAFAYGNFHNRFMRDRVTIVGCPKLDAVDYSGKLAEIFQANDIRSITVTRMTVPCCGGLENAVRRAIEASGKNIPLEVVTIDLDGTLVE